MDRPRCITHNVISVDGRLTIAPGVSLLAGDPRWEAAAQGLGDPYAWVRRTHDPQVLLEGSGSFVPDEAPGPKAPGAPADPSRQGAHRLSGSPPHHLPGEVVAARGRRWFAVVDGRGRVDLQFTEWPDPAWAGWHALVLTSRAAPSDHLARLRRRGIPYLVVGDEHVDLPEALRLLASELAVRTVVCTGGGRLGGALLRTGLVDEIDLDILPVAIGGRGTPALFDAPVLGPDEWPVPLELIGVERHAAGALRVRYAVRR